MFSEWLHLYSSHCFQSWTIGESGTFLIFVLCLDFEGVLKVNISHFKMSPYGQGIMVGVIPTINWVFADGEFICSPQLSVTCPSPCFLLSVLTQANQGRVKQNEACEQRWVWGLDRKWYLPPCFLCCLKISYKNLAPYNINWIWTQKNGQIVDHDSQQFPCICSAAF